MSIDTKSLTLEEYNQFFLRMLSVLGEEKYSQLAYWPFEDISIDELSLQFYKFQNDEILKKSFVKYAHIHINKKKNYLIIEGFLNLIKIFESLERYEDCVILKAIKDSILIDLKPVV